MGTHNADSSCSIHPSMDLEDVFLHFLDRFETLPNPRSVAEARITTSELEALTLWFSQQWDKPRTWCESTFQVDLPHGMFASTREMFGALLLILASEVCRANSTEDAVWPAVTAVLKADRVSFPALFVGGQPTTVCKKAVAAGALRLKLRNLIDRYGAQEYFDTLKLQFGFTLHGAVRKLPEWLDGMGLPIAVRILTGVESEHGHLKSSSFDNLWKALQDFRRSRVSDEYTSEFLQTSPWIRPEWASELMSAAKLRLGRTSAPSDTSEVRDRSNEPVCERILRWEYPSKPQLSLRLNEERIYELLGESDIATFTIDGQVVDRWTAQESGGWHGKRELPCQPQSAKPNLWPKLLSISSGGTLIEEIDFLEMGMSEPLLIFDLKRGTSVDIESKLDPSREYALLCALDLSVPDANQCFKSKDRCAYRLASPWNQDLRVLCDGILYWQPRFDHREPLRPIRLTLESLPGETAEIGSACRVNVTGVPDEATAVSLIAGSSSSAMTHHGAVWQTERPLQITLGMALGEERIRVRLGCVSYVRTVTPRSALNLRGIACLETDSNTDAEPKWTLLSRDRPLNRADGSGRARVFVETAKSQLYEGARFVGKISSRALQLRDLSGWGSQLIIRSERQSDTVLVESVEDYGSGKFLPSLFKGQTGACLAWRIPMSPGQRHRILVWPDIFQPPRKSPVNKTWSQKDDVLWKLPNLGSVAAMAIAHDGFRIASYWATAPMIQALKYAQSSGLFALLRWLKLPVLNPRFRTLMQEAVVQSPSEFVSGWMDDKALQDGLVHRETEQGVDVVIREFLWNHADRNITRMERLAQVFSKEDGPQSEAEAFKSSLLRLGEICPSLSYNLASHKLRSDKYRKYVRAVAAEMLQQPRDFPHLRERLTVACRDCANLIGIAPETLEANVNAFGSHLDHLDNQASNYKQAEPDLRRLGEMLRGRQFLTASLLLRLVERSRF